MTVIQEKYKGFVIAGDGTFGNKLIKPAGKGSIPDILIGRYTNSGFAKKAIDLYLNTPSKIKKAS